ncbi:MAG: CHASE domain-containing protein [Bacteroidota bacterium]|nr:CHASE domain-containing protein [Candidatus Kapabacteria bacterium]MCX7937551.1 CHASE domain-containing protein [Chlorobiota bacterium]MDW8270806.1 CHASE domain-containing protein [Bacteroidota bacterium]
MYTAQIVAEENIRTRLPLSKYLVVVSILLGGIALSVAIMYILDNSLRTRRQMEFERAVSSVITRIEQGVVTYENVLRNLDGLYRNSVQVVRDVFELYSTVPAESNPAIRSIGYANLVSARELPEFIFYARSERYYDYSLIPPGKRPEYVPILYAVPYPKRRDLIGFDMLSKPELAETITRAQGKRSIVGSQVFRFRGDTMSIFLMVATQQKKTANVLLPTTHSRFDGVLFVELDFAAFLKYSLSDSVASDRKLIFAVSDNSAGMIQTQLASFGSLDSIHEGAFHAERFVAFADRAFKFEFWSSPALTAGIESYFGLFALIAGIAITLTLSGFMLSVMSSQQRAVTLADRITEGNRRILEASRDIIGAINLDGKWLTVNPAVQTILGYSPEEIRGTLIVNYISTDTERIRLMSALANQQVDEHQIDVRMRTREGAERWISWNISIARAENIAYIIGRDVTLERQAQQELTLRARQVQLAEQLAQEASASKSAFIRRLTRYLRSSLITTLDGMHKMVMNMDPTNDRHVQFVKLANESSDRLFGIVSDLLDVAHDTEYAKELNTPLTTILRHAEQLYTKAGGRISFIERSIHRDVCLSVEEHTVASGLANLFLSLSTGASHGAIEITTLVNTQEYVLELQVLAPYIQNVALMIAQFNRSQSALVDALASDRDEIMFRLGLAASQIRRVGGTFSVETLGEEGNVALITLPLVENN